MKKFLFVVVFAFIGSLVFAQERIAVFPFEDMENVLTRNEAVMFYREFSNAFANRSAGRFSVVPRQEVERLINTEATFQLSDFSAREKTAEMNRVLNSTQILSGLIGKLGNNIRITVSLYTYPELQQLPGGATVSASNVDELFSRIPELVQSMQSIIAGGGIEQSIPEGLIYKIDRRTVTITGYIGNATTLTIPNSIAGFPVTSIASIDRPEFSESSTLTSVTIPSSVTSIGYGAFTGGTVIIEDDGVFWEIDRKLSLANITVDNRNSVYASIDGVLFDKNIRTLITYPQGKNQRAYSIPSSVTSIGTYAFRNCGILTSITIPSSVTSIEGGAFRDCSSLTSVTIPSSVTVIGRFWFYGCSSLTSVTIPSSVTQISDHAFYGCSSLTSVTIPSSVKWIEYRTFYGCNSLTGVTIGANVYTADESFGVNNFVDFYNAQGRRAGTYIYRNGSWSRR